MPKIICDAVTCKFNNGNADFIENYRKGSFECVADEVVTFKTTEDCECGAYINETFCQSYELKTKER